MSINRVGIFTGVLAACALIGNGAAQATVLNDSVSLAGSLPANAPLPFASGPFTLNFSLPSTSFASGYSLGDVYSIVPSNSQNGTYVGGGQSNVFGAPSMAVIGTSSTAFEIFGDIGSYPTSVTFTGTTQNPFFTTQSSPSGVTYTLLPGVYSLTDTAAIVNNDPPFTLGVLTIGGSTSTVPEPSTLALFALPLAALALIRRRKPRARV